MSDDSIKLEMDLPLPELPEMPVWVATLLVAIGAIVPMPASVAFAALSALCAPLQVGGSRRDAFMALPLATQDIIRAAKSVKLAEINTRERDASTQRQAIPVVVDAPVADVAPVATPTVLRGTWTMIQNGPHANTWGAKIVNVTSVQVGQLVRLYKNGATRGSLHVVVAFGMRDANTAICAVRDATTLEREEARLGTTPGNGVPVQTPEREPSGGTVADHVHGDEAPTTIEASLGETVTQGTTLAQDQIPSYERTVAPVVATAPTSVGITTTPTGPSIFDRPRTERTFRVGQNATPSERSRIMGERDLVVGALAGDTGESWLQVSWTGGGETESGIVNDALMLIDRETDAPGVPGAEGYAGAAVASLRNTEYDVKRLAASKVPSGCTARWIVGRALTVNESADDDSYGKRLLYVDLTDDDTLRFDGDLNLGSAVRSHYAAATVKKTLDSRTLTPWVGRILRTRHGAVKRGHNWYVPPGHAASVRALIAAIEPLWGDFDVQSVMTKGDLFSALSKGLSAEISKVACEFAEKTVDAQNNARERETAKAAKLYGATEASITAAGDLAYRRATIGNTLAARMLRDLGTCAARVSAYRQVFGDDIADPIAAKIATLRETLAKLTDDTSARAAMLELE